ncbi:hypothetical protein SAMN04489733_2494 [Amycolatopsis keratiniphila]|nr:hypothetical protein SAMN04489733_2494 [Amycolatopsis keratiniphila]
MKQAQGFTYRRQETMFLDTGREFMRRTAVAVAVASCLVVTGCGGQTSKSSSASSTSTSKSAAPQVMKFGEERAGKRGVVTVGKPAGYDLPADPQRPKELTRGAKFTVTVRNTAKKALEASAFTFTATTNGAASVSVTDAAKGIGDKLPADVLPGTDRTFGLVVALPANAAEVTVKVAYQGVNPLYWTGTA